MAGKYQRKNPNLNARQLKTFSEALLLIHAPLDLPSVPGAAIAALDKLLQGDCYAYNEFHTDRVVTISAPDQLDEKTSSAFEFYIGEHPSVKHVAATNMDEAIRLSDVATTREWRATNLYNHVFRIASLKYQLGCIFPITQTSQAAFSINRISCDFSVEQRDLMTLLTPHFAQAWARANAVSQRDSALACVAVAEVDRFCRILFATEKAAALIARYRTPASLSPRQLPEPYRGWLLRNIQKAQEFESFTPLLLEAGGHQLTVRLAASTGQDGYQLHFEEKTVVTAAQVADHLGLTPRQGEVLYWIAEGKSNEEIGLILGAKVRTIAKHVEQIFVRIGVENRATAARLWHDSAAILRA